MADFIRIHPGDNVAVALKAIPAGTKIGSVTVTINAVAAPTAFTFTVNNVEYTAMTGMTWGEWLDSEYNTSAANNFELGAIWDEEHDNKMCVSHSDIELFIDHIVTRDGTYAGRVFSADTIDAVNYTCYERFIE